MNANDAEHWERVRNLLLHVELRLAEEIKEHTAVKADAYAMYALGLATGAAEKYASGPEVDELLARMQDETLDGVSPEQALAWIGEARRIVEAKLCASTN